MGRPKKLPDERRTETIRARVTVAEFEHVHQQARAAGLDVSEYVRRRAVGYVVPPAPVHRRADPGVVTELNRLGLELKAIGNNANQIALALNAGRRSSQPWEEVVRRIKQLTGEVSGTLEDLLLHDP